LRTILSLKTPPKIPAPIYPFPIGNDCDSHEVAGEEYFNIRGVLSRCDVTNKRHTITNIFRKKYK
jgi:hypothetical protein